MSNEQPQPEHFLDLKHQDLAPWRDQPISRLLCQWLNEERQACLETIALAVESDKVNEARVYSGRLRQLVAFTAALHPPERPQPLAEEEFEDPAALKVKK